MIEHVIADVASGLGATVTVVDADEGTELTGLDLELVFEDEVGLDDGQGEISGGVPSDIAVPKQSISTFSSDEIGCSDHTDLIESLSVVLPEWLPAQREQIHQCLKHPTSLKIPNPSSSPRTFFNLLLLRIQNRNRNRSGPPSLTQREREREKREKETLSFIKMWEGGAQVKREVGAHVSRERLGEGCVRW